MYHFSSSSSSVSSKYYHIHTHICITQRIITPEMYSHVNWCCKRGSDYIAPESTDPPFARSLHMIRSFLILFFILFSVLLFISLFIFLLYISTTATGSTGSFSFFSFFFFFFISFYINMYIFIVYEQFSVHVNVLYGVYIAQRDILFTICTLGERPIYELRDIPVK